MNGKVGDTERQSFRDKGFSIAQGIVDTSVCAELYRSVVLLANKYSSNFPISVIDLEPWESDEFNQAFMTLRQDNPTQFGAVYDCVQNSGLLYHAVGNQRILDAAATVLDADVSGLAATGAMMRMDAPSDERNSLDWHQDGFYYEQNLRGENGCVLWFPLHTFNKDYGSIIICPESHKAGKLMVDGSGKNDYEVSEQYHVPKEEIEKYEQLTIEIPCGDAIFFNMDLLHRSGRNTTEKFRFTAGVRFHKMLEDDFFPGRMHYKFNTKIGRLSDKATPS